MLLALFLWLFCEFDEKVLDNLSLADENGDYFIFLYSEGIMS